MREEIRSHHRLAAEAQRQHGVISHAQLRELGYSTGAIGRAQMAGRLHRLHRGVYAVGHARLSHHGRCAAALLACGHGAVLSHLSAAWLWGFVSGWPSEVEVTVPTGANRRNGLRLHRSHRLAKEDRAALKGIATTGPARTLIDGAEIMTARFGSNGRGKARGDKTSGVRATREVERMVERASRLGLLDLHDIDAALARAGRRRGRLVLCAALDLYRDPAFTRSRLERIFLDLVRKAGLPRPAMNTFTEGYEIDAYWEAERFAVELDGYETHGTRAAFERDPVRQEDLKLAGIDSVRITARRLEREPAQVATRLKMLLARRRREIRR